MTNQQSDEGGTYIWLSKPSSEKHRPSLPLAMQNTPRFLRKYIYCHKGELFAFDEASLPTERQRRLARLAGRVCRLRNEQRKKRMSEALSKRKTDEVSLSHPASKRLAIAAQESDPDAGADSPPRMPDLSGTHHDDPFVDPVTTPAEMNSSTTAVMPPPPPPLPSLSPTSHEVSAVGATSLLSPTASPKVSPYEAEDPALLPPPLDAQVLDLVPNILDQFDQLPPETHRYVLYSLMRSCDRNTLSSMVSILTSALRCNILSELPPELSSIVLSYLDAKSLCSAARVCKSWYKLIEQDETVWKNLLEQDQLFLTDTDMKRALTEGWAYRGWTRDLSDPPHRVSSFRGLDTRNTQSHSQELPSTPAARRVSAMLSLASPFAPNLPASAQGTPVNDPSSPATWGPPRPRPLNALGDPVNVYKAIYRRKLLISRNWMSPNKRPRHFSIPCAARDTITCLEFDEDRIIAGSDSKSINVYDTRTGELLHNFDEHEGGVWALKYINKDILVSGSVDRTVRVWSISKAKCTHVFRGHTSTVRCLDVVMPVPHVDPETGNTVYVPPRPVIVTGSRDATLRMWWLPGPDDPEYHAPDANVDDSENPFFIQALTGHQNPVRAINGYEDTVVSGSYDNTVRVWRISDGKCRHELVGHQQKVYSALLDHKRNRCISASMDWSVKVWCIETGSLLYTLEGHTSLVGLLDLSRTMLVSAAADSTLRVWDPETGMLLHKLEGHKRAITCFQHDETKVISGSECTLKLWNIKTGELIGDLFNGIDLAAIWQVGFDSRRCVSAVSRDSASYLEVLDFDYDPNETLACEPFSDESDGVLEFGDPVA